MHLGDLFILFVQKDSNNITIKIVMKSMETNFKV